MKIIKVASRDDYLRGLGASEEIISYIISLDDNLGNFVTNKFRLNPSLSLDEIKSINLPVRKGEILDREKRLVNSLPDGMKNWAIFNIRKVIRSNHGYLPSDDTNYFFLFSQIFRQYELDEVKDWFIAISPNLSSITLEDALAESKDWHRAIAGEGSSNYYLEKDIFYGPSWVDKEGNEREDYYGWSIREIKTKNDLTVEGNRMNHCVGGYWDDHNDCMRRNVRIFSLRDQANHPHVTIETDQSGNYAEQIKGNSNSEPDDEYKAMIKFWVENGNSPLKYISEDEDKRDGLTFSRYGMVNSYLENVEEYLTTSSTENKYGLEVKSDYQYVIETILKNGKEMLNRLYERSSYGYSGDRGLCDMLSEYVVASGDDAIAYYIDELDKVEQEANEKFNEFIFNSDIGLPYPQEDDYETIEEFDDAVSSYESENDEHMDSLMEEDIMVGWSRDLYKSLEKYLKQKKGIDIYRFTESRKVEANWYKGFRKSAGIEDIKKKNISDEEITGIEKLYGYEFRQDSSDVRDDFKQPGFIGSLIKTVAKGGVSQESVQGYIYGYRAIVEDNFGNLEDIDSGIFEYYDPECDKEDFLLYILEKTNKKKVFYVSNFAVLKDSRMESYNLLENFFSKLKKSSYEYIAFDALPDTMNLVMKGGKPNPSREERFGIKMLCKVETQDGHSLFLARIVKETKKPWYNIF